MADSLREQFVNMLKILFINDKDVEIAENVEVEMCCNNNDACISKCQECKYNERIKVDVALYAAYDDQRFYYSFRPTDNFKIEYIDNKEKMFKELAFLSACVVNASIRQDAEYLQKIEKLKNYAKDFFKILCSDYFKEINDTILPIQFLPFYDNRADASFEELIKEGGTYKRTDKQKIIEIYRCRVSDEEDIKQSIKHEIIHYCLDIAGLKCNDDSAVFHILATLCDAKAYMDMPLEEQKIYDNFFKVYNDWNNFEEQFKRNNVTKQDYIRVIIYNFGKKDIDKTLIEYIMEVIYGNKRFA